MTHEDLIEKVAAFAKELRWLADDLQRIDPDDPAWKRTGEAWVSADGLADDLARLELDLKTGERVA